jgi:hypothetical protein
VVRVLNRAIEAKDKLLAETGKKLDKSEEPKPDH